jgi:hypothetical protein
MAQGSTTPRANIVQIGGSAIAIGQAAMAASFPVVLASNQSAIPVTQSGTWNIGTLTTITNVVHVDDNGGSLTVDGTVAVTNADLTTIAGAVRAEDAASADGHTGIGALAVRKATPANTSGTDGDYEFLQMSAGRLWVSAVIDTALPAGTNAIGKLAANSGVTIGAVEIAAAQTLATVTTVGTVTTITNVVHIDDNAGSITVDGTVTATIAAGATTIAKAEDAASADGDVGVGMLAVRKATPANTSGADGDYEFLQMSAGRLWVDPSGVTLTVASHAVTNAGTFATQESGSWIQVDDAAFTPATSKIAMVGAEFDDTSPDSVDEGDGGALRMSANRNLYVRIRDNAGNERGLNIDANGALAATVTNATAANLNATVVGTGTFATQENGAALTSLQLIDDVVYTDDTSTHSTGSSKGVGIMAAATPTDTAVNANDIGMLAMTLNRELLVQVNTALPAGTNAIGKLAANSGVDIGDVDVTSIIPGTGATNLGKAEDAAFADADVGVMALSVRKNTAAATSGTDGDYQPLITDTNGRLHVINSAGEAGDVAHDSADSGNPIKIGGKARQTNPTAVADGDRVDAMFDDVGRQVTILGQVRDLIGDQTTTITSSTSETTIATAVASTFLDIVSLMVANTSATATRIDFRDSTGGSVRFSMYIPAGTTMGTNPTRPIKQTTVNNNWTAQCGTSVADIRIYVQFEKNV